jgi:hypothetical protein
VFLGDIMQLITRGYFKATVHRVTAYDTNTPSAVADITAALICDRGSGGVSRRVDLRNRISCPFLIRGRHRTEIQPLSAYRRYPCKSLPIGYTPPVVQLSSGVDGGVVFVDTADEPPPAILPAASESLLCSPAIAALAPPSAPTDTDSSTSGASKNESKYAENSVIVDLPDLEETTMKMIHKLLDLKRHKCTRENQCTGGNGQDEPNRDWVLSAFPVTIYDDVAKNS